MRSPAAARPPHRRGILWTLALWLSLSFFGATAFAMLILALMEGGRVLARPDPPPPPRDAPAVRAFDALMGRDRNKDEK